MADQQPVKTIELSSFLVNVIKDDADYFQTSGFINADTYNRVQQWLAGTPDNDIQLQVSIWLHNDSQYVSQLRQALLDRYWYAAPLLFLMINDLSNALEEGSVKLRP